MKHEVLYEVFIPKDDDEELLKTMNTNSTFLADLEHESVRLTGNLPGEELKALLPSKWTPKGKIRYYDNSLNRWEPVIGAKVQARYLTHIETSITKSDGSFKTDQFRYQVNYAIKWERADFEIRDGRISQAWYNGPKKKGDWDLEFQMENQCQECML